MKLAFPDNFKWGTAISAFQTEMGVSKEAVVKNTDWFVWSHSEELIKEGLVSGDLPENGDGFWDTYREDMNRAKEMGNNTIRLSIEWARLLPHSTFEIGADVKETFNHDILKVSLNDKELNELIAMCDYKAVEHYRSMLSYAKKLELSVFLTLYHWPLPSWIHDPLECYKDPDGCKTKGWLDKRTVIEFGKYASFASKMFSDLVDVWETINEPEVIASQGYLFGKFSGFPPGLNDLYKTMMVERNLVFAHSVAYENIKKYAVNKEVGIGIAPPYFQAVDENPQNRRMAEYAQYLNNEWFLNGAIYGFFDNDLDMMFDEKVEGLNSPDFIGLDYYTRIRVKYQDIPDVPEILKMELQSCENCTDFMWDIYPEGIRIVTKRIFEKYRRPIYILENGIADKEDKKRAKFLFDHLRQLSMVINEDNVPVRGYYHWSLIDNYEWAKGYSMRFGLYKVDYKTKERTATKAVEIYKKICNNEDIEYDRL